jgi:hypothetical protein
VKDNGAQQARSARLETRRLQFLNCAAQRVAAMAATQQQDLQAHALGGIGAAQQAGE